MIFYTEYATVPVVDECSVRDVVVAWWDTDPAIAGDTVSVWTTVQNTGGVFPDDFDLGVADREGWAILPSLAQMFLVPGEDSLHVVEIVVPETAIPGETNEVYVTATSAACPGVTCTDTIGIEVEAPTGVGEDAPAPAGIVHRAYPNPFNPSVTIAYTVPAPGGEATVEVFDVAGRRVATLYAGPRSAGGYRATWTGRSDLGTPVASGVYVYRISVGGLQVSGKLVLAR
jgi:hypothetical protein